MKNPPNCNPATIMRRETHKQPCEKQQKAGLALCCRRQELGVGSEERGRGTGS